MQIPIPENYPHFAASVLRHPRKALRAFMPLRTHPNYFWVEVTNRCNLRCRSCGKTYGVEESNVDMDLALFRRIFAQIAPCAQTISLTGVGETLCHPQARQIFDEFEKFPGVEVEIVTNGQLATEEWLQRFARMRCVVDFSVDGTDEETYRFNRPGARLALVENALARAVELERASPDPSRFAFRRRINFVVMRKNMHQIPEIVTWAEKYRCVAIVFLLMMRWGCDDAFWQEQNPLNYRDELAPLLNEAARRAREKGILISVPPVSPGLDDLCPIASARRAEGWLGWFKPNNATLAGAPRFENKTCPLPRYALYFRVDGKAIPCCTARDFVLGDARTQTVGEIWNSPRMRHLRMCMAVGSHRAFCRTCNFVFGLAQGNPFDPSHGQ